VLHVGDRVVFAGTEHSVVALSGTAVRLVSVSGETTVAALALLLAADDFAIVGAGPALRLEPAGLLAGLPQKVVEAARAWERHLIEVESGVVPGSVPRPQYGPARPMLEREEAKAAELTAAGTATSVRTVRRMRKRYREQGLLGLVDARYLRRASLTGRVDERVVAAALAVVDAQTQTSTGTKSRALRQIKARLDAEYGPGVVAMPSRTTAYRLLDALSAGRYSFGSAVTRRQTANKPQGAYTPTFAARPGEQVQIDATPLDVMAVMDDGVIGRPELVAAVDVATRTICAAVLQPAGAKAVDAALLLARMMVPEPMRPGWETVLRMSASRLPYKRLLEIDRRLELAAAKPVIVPETVVIDHGKIFVSETFTRAAKTLGISVQPARPYQGSDKGVIERTFESINTLFCQHVAGYTGRDVTQRGADVADRAVWSVADLQDLLDEFVLAGWQSRPHEGLRHPYTPDRALSPNEAYAALVAAAGYVPISLGADDYIELLPVRHRVIGDGGIQIDYRTYNCDELKRLRWEVTGFAQGEKCEVHIDPYDVSRVWVRRPDRRGWITVPWTQLGLVRAPFADFSWRHARRVAAQRGVDDTHETAVAVVLSALLARAEQGPSLEQRALARARAATAMPGRIPAALLPAPTEPDSPAPQVAQPPPDPEVEPESEAPVLIGQIEPFGLFDAAEEGGTW
jgi:hypothetical protein